METSSDYCREAIYSNDYYDVIINYNEYIQSDLITCIQRVSDIYDIAYLSRELVPPLSVNIYNYSAIPNCFTLLDQTALEKSGILTLQNQPVLNLRGSGILIGFVDTGIDYTHPAFRNGDGTTRISAIWDQTLMEGPSPDGFSYGTLFDENDINAALASETPAALMPTTDTNGHGTFLAGIAAGSPDESGNFIGAAPLASIAMVKLKPAKQYLRDFYFINPETEVYQENDIMLALSWLNQLAYQLQMPLVICLALGSNMGSHGGNSPLSDFLNDISRRRLRVIVSAAGNETNARHHFMGTDLAPDSYEDVEISVGAHVSGFVLELWARAPELFTVDILSPTGEVFSTRPGRTNQSSEYSFIFENTTVSVDYRLVGLLTGDQLIFMRFKTPLQGLWTIRVYANQVIKGAFNMWLPMTNFLTGEVIFLRSSPDITITVPSMASGIITVGAYNAADGSLYPDSGRGLVTFSLIKPELAAPGVNITGPQPLPAGAPPAAGAAALTTRTGTSVAAAITAGACAQLMEWTILRQNNTQLNTSDFKNMLILGADRNPDISYPNNSWGFGTLNVYESLNQFRSR